jgi:hypothetical protein
MSKKGQLTLFISLTILIVVVIVLFISTQNFLKEDSSKEEINLLKEEVRNCLEKSYISSLKQNSIKGGFNNLNKTIYLQIKDDLIPYYYYQKESFLPSLETMEKNLEESSEDLINICIQELVLKNKNNNIGYSEFKIYSKIKSKEVNFNSNLKINFEQENKTTIIDFSREIFSTPSNLKEMHNLAEGIINLAIEDEAEWLRLSQIDKEAKEEGLKITIIDITEESNSFLFIIEDNSLENNPKTFQFLNKYIFKEINYPESI